MSQWHYTMLSKWCQYGCTMMLFWCHNESGVYVEKWCHCGCIMMSKWCHGFVIRQMNRTGFPNCLIVSRWFISKKTKDSESARMRRDLRGWEILRRVDIHTMVRVLAYTRHCFILSYCLIVLLQTKYIYKTITYLIRQFWLPPENCLNAVLLHFWCVCVWFSLVHGGWPYPIYGTRFDTVQVGRHLGFVAHGH